MIRKKFPSALFSVFASSLFLTSVGAFAGDKLIKHTESERVPGHYIVVLRPGLPSMDADKLIKSMAPAGRTNFSYQNVFKGFAADLSQDELTRLEGDLAVDFIEEDAIVKTSDVQRDPPSWGLDRIDQKDLPLNDHYIFDNRGLGVNVYVVDTGIRTMHEDIERRAFPGFTSISDGQGTNDCNGHGTHVSATIGGTSYGVAKGVTLFAVRVLDCSGSGTLSGVIAGLDWVHANHKKPAVINMSLGGGASSALDAALDSDIQVGITAAVAAGNSNSNACDFSPARVPRAIAAGASDITDKRASFSNFGSCVSIFAPGVNITSAWNGSDTDKKTISGTSMASPHVAGVAALYLEEHPHASPEKVKAALIRASIQDKIKDPRGSPNFLLQNWSDELF